MLRVLALRQLPVSQGHLQRWSPLHAPSVATFSSMAERWVPAPFCRGLDSPPYQVLEETPDYELRQYAPSRWVTCETAACTYGDVASGGMFNRLFQYISGFNTMGQKIAMTVPVLTSIVPGQGPTCESTVSMSFYLPSNLSAPLPSDRSVQLTQLPAMAVYVRSFGGFMGPQDAASHAASLARAIGNPQRFDGTRYYTAGYDSPFRATNRHNEVWLIKR